MGSKSPKSKGNKDKKNKGKRNIGIESSGFFAYPNLPKDRCEIIESAVTLVNKQQSKTKFRLVSWAGMSKRSARIISNIIEEIKKAEIFFADISGLNFNVLFEVGFAFGKQKKLLLLTQGFSTQERNEDLKELELINGLNIDTYQNSEKLAEYILKNIDNTQAEILKYGVNLNDNSKVNTGLFLKGYADHEIGLAALNTFKEVFTKVNIDDWAEDSAQNLRWYVSEIVKSSGIAALFVDAKWDNSRKINARFSFLCGLAVALDKRVLMIGLPEFSTPLDYKDILIIPKSASIAKNAIIKYFRKISLAPTVQELTPNIEEVVGDNRESSKELDKQLVLLDINIGNSIAENEEEELSEYFVQTGPYINALNATQLVIVGSKGSGKTANFFRLRDDFRKHSKNFVCEIKPSDYKMERFLNTIRKLDQDNGLEGHIIENVWKTIIYCEIIEVFSNELKEKLSIIGQTENGDKLLAFAEKHSELINSPFERKLEIASKWLEEVAFDADNFSKKIHDSFLSEAKRVLLPFFTQRKKAVILLDNLDKAWAVDSDLDLQAKVVLNLLGINRRLKSDFNIDVSLLIFLRRNIFEYILRFAREPDKLITESLELIWDDGEMLLRVLEERFKKVIDRWGGTSPNEDIWNTFFCPVVDAIPIKIWIYKNIMPRPRDLIHFVQKAIEWAINRGHSEIQEGDLLTAQKSYSAFALEQIIAEYKAEEPWIVDTLRMFTGSMCILNYDKLEDLLSQTITSETEIIRAVVFLVSVGFLGVKFDNNEAAFEFVTDLESSRTMATLVKNSTQRKRYIFKIHPVFYNHLRVRVNDYSVSGKVE
ncbi:MAG: P-loop ATPase, Sll1717 family [Desulfitobacteriaceae bacterium]